MVRRLFDDHQRENERGNAAVVWDSIAASTVVLGRPAAPDDAAEPVLAPPLAVPERRATVRPGTRAWSALW
jgi:hypothetical protein